MDLMIVESPNKTKTIEKYLGGTMRVKASVGHIKQLSDVVKNPGDIGGVELANRSYAPEFQIAYNKKTGLDKRQVVSDLKKAAQGCNTIYIATDPDREGFAIGMHLYQELYKICPNIKRVEFHEITEKAVKEGLAKAVDFKTGTNWGLYDAFLGRCVLDKMVGYILSPLSGRALGNMHMSVGRVQSPAVRIIVDREKEIKNFKPEAYYNLSVELDKNGTKFNAKYDFNGQIKDEAKAKAILAAVQQAPTAKALSADTKETKSSPFAPFTTSTFQMTAASRLHIAPERAMALAQELFAAGLITYMRTDSSRLAPEFIAEARPFIQKQFGNNYLYANPAGRQFKSKNSQADAHEAIRPTHVKSLTEYEAEIRKAGMADDHIKIFNLIFERAVGCQMAEAVFDATTVKLDVSGQPFVATGRVKKFDGFLKLMQEDEFSSTKEKKGPEGEEEKDQMLPPISTGETVKKTGAKNEQKFTKPPYRYSEGSLIRELEKKGIGRPSTYATIMTTIKGNFKSGKPTRVPYVTIVKGKLEPTQEGIALIEWLNKSYSWAIDYDMTKGMEEYLDQVEDKKAKWQKLCENTHAKMGFALAGQGGERTLTPKFREWVQKLAMEARVTCPEFKDYEDAAKFTLGLLAPRINALAKENHEQVPQDTFTDLNKALTYIQSKSKPSEKQVAFAKSLAAQKGLNLTESILSSALETKKFIDKAMKAKAVSVEKMSPEAKKAYDDINANRSLSDKQKEVLIKLGKPELVNNFVEGKKAIDEYFQNSSKGGSKTGGKSYGNKSYGGKKTYNTPKPATQTSTGAAPSNGGSTGRTLSEKQKEVLRKMGKPELINNYELGKQAIDDYFSKKNGNNR